MDNFYHFSALNSGIARPVRHRSATPTYQLFVVLRIEPAPAIPSPIAEDKTMPIPKFDFSDQKM